MIVDCLNCGSEHVRDVPTRTAGYVSFKCLDCHYNWTEDLTPWEADDDEPTVRRMPRVEE